MPGKGLLASLTDKAQAAIAASPLAGKIPTGSSQAGTDDTPAATTTQQTAHVPPTQDQSSPLSGRYPGLEAIQHQLRTLQVQYSSGVSQENRQLQLLITATKGVALDYDTAGRDAKSQSKELYLWGQTQSPDIKDVTDRLAYLNFVQGALSYTLATDIDKSRTSWKNVRDAEAALAPRRAARSNITAQIDKIKTEGGRPGSVDARIAELAAQLKKAEADDAPVENELDLLKRTAIKESETIKWKALQEYAHKLLLLAGASEQLLRILPSSPPENYTGHQQTAAVRAALQNALDSGYIPQTEHLPLNVGQNIGETRSFGETHASELNTITTVSDNGHEALNRVSHDSAAPINPAALNNAAASIPSTSTGAPRYAPPAVAPPPSSPPVSSTNLPKSPTVAETGVPLSAGAAGPGPATGTLGHADGTHEQAPPYGGAAAIATAHESAEEEKRRLAALVQEQNAVPIGGLAVHGHLGGLQASTSTRRPATHEHETAEDEKKRLEREERERILRSNREPTQDDSNDPSGAAPPAYQD